MGLFDFLSKRDNSNAASARRAAALASGEQVEQARTRARRRLIGAVVLLGVGVVAFPILFETQPRPIPVDIPIEIPSREGTVPLPVPTPKAATPRAAAPAVEAPREPVVTPPPTAATSTKPVEPAAKPAVAPAPKEVIEAPKPVVAAAAPAANTAEARFVVQVGAFAEANAVREARAKVEKLGLATYTQAVDTPNGKRTRVRVGPYSSRDEAEKAAARLKSAGLPGSVLTL